MHLYGSTVVRLQAPFWFFWKHLWVQRCQRELKVANGTPKEGRKASQRETKGSQMAFKEANESLRAPQRKPKAAKRTPKDGQHQFIKKVCFSASQVPIGKFPAVWELFRRFPFDCLGAVGNGPMSTPLSLPPTPTPPEPPRQPLHPKALTLQNRAEASTVHPVPREPDRRRYRHIFAINHPGPHIQCICASARLQAA